MSLRQVSEVAQHHRLREPCVGRRAIRQACKRSLPVYLDLRPATARFAGKSQSAASVEGGDGPEAALELLNRAGRGG